MEFTSCVYRSMNVKPLKTQASQVGGLLEIVMSTEADEMSRDEFFAKARTWLAVLKAEVMKNGRRK